MHGTINIKNTQLHYSNLLRSQQLVTIMQLYVTLPCVFKVL